MNSEVPHDVGYVLGNGPQVEIEIENNTMVSPMAVTVYTTNFQLMF